LAAAQFLLQYALVRHQHRGSALGKQFLADIQAIQQKTSGLLHGQYGELAPLVSKDLREMLHTIEQLNELANIILHSADAFTELSHSGHKLRGALGAVMGYGIVLAFYSRQSLTPPQVTALNYIQTTCERILSNINNLVLYARVQTQQLPAVTSRLVNMADIYRTLCLQTRLADILTLATPHYIVFSEANRLQEACEALWHGLYGLIGVYPHNIHFAQAASHLMIHLHYPKLPDLAPYFVPTWTKPVLECNHHERSLVIAARLLQRLNGQLSQDGESILIQLMTHVEAVG